MTYMYTQMSTDTLTRNEILVGVEFLSQLVDNFFTQTEPFTYRAKDDVFARIRIKRYNEQTNSWVVDMTDEAKNFIIALMAK